MESAMEFQASEVILPQRFIQDDGGRIAQVEGALACHHGDADAVFLVCGQNFLRDAAAFRPEHDEIIRSEGNICIELMGLRGCQPDAVTGGSAAECRIVIVDSRMEPRPLVEPCPPDILVGQLKTERFDQMKPRTGGNTGSSDIAGIVWDFGFKKHKIQHRQIPFSHVFIPLPADRYSTMNGSGQTEENTSVFLHPQECHKISSFPTKVTH
jgi:hypothetical protein